MNLQRMYDLASSKSYFSRSDDEVWAALNSAARFIYQNVTRENQGYWIKWDTASISLQPGVTEYTLPEDCQQLLRVRERRTTSESWRLVDTARLTDSAMLRSQAPDFLYFDDAASDFSFYGPYLDQASASDGTDAQVQRLQIGPPPKDAREVELVYVAKYVEVLDSSSYLMIPDDLRDAMLDLAVAELTRSNNDTLSGDYQQSGMAKLTIGLTLIRDRQLEQQRTVEPYLDE